MSFVRYALPLAAVIGATLAFAPTAGATTAAPIVQSVSFSTSFGTTNACNGMQVDTAGRGTVTVTTAGQHTTITIRDNETGDGFDFITVGTGQFDSLASEYLVPVESRWLNLRDPALDFRASFDYTVTVNGNNTPLSFGVGPITTTCDL